jgi:hypothetical protein
VIAVTGNRADALARLDVFAGEWVVEARFPGDQPTPSNATGEGALVRSRFGWALDGQFLLQRTEVPFPEAPDSLTIVSIDLQTGTFSKDGNTISGAWEKCLNGGEWEHDFVLTYRRAARGPAAA